MNHRETAIQIIRTLPPEASLLDMARAIEFVAGIKKGTAELDGGKHLTAEDLRQKISSWANHSRA